MRHYWNRPLGSKLIILGAIAFLAISFAPWQRPCNVTPTETLCGFVVAWTGFGIWAGLLVIAVLVWELLPVVWPQLSMRGWPTAIITAILAVALAIITLVKLIDDNTSQTRWAWIGFAIALFVMLVALLRVRHRWDIRGKDAEPQSAAQSDTDAPAV